MTVLEVDYFFSIISFVNIFHIPVIPKQNNVCLGECMTKLNCLIMNYATPLVELTIVFCDLITG